MENERSQTNQSTATEQPSRWDVAFAEVERARETNTTPNPDVFRDLTKSAGGD
jgi:hypothetical protein